MKDALIRFTQTAALALLLTGTVHAAGGHGDHSMSMSGSPHGEALQAAATAIGKPGDAARATRTIDIDMNDAMRFTPDRIQVQAGETVRIHVRNTGRIRHELVLGTNADLKTHYDMMIKDPGMRHEDANAVSLDAGESGQIIWQFGQAGTVSFGCLEPGHYPAGMKGAVSVQ